MAYVPYTWANLPLTTTPISKANLDHLETQYDEADAELTTHENLTTAHGAVSAATASRIVVRDGSARAKFAAPNAAGDALIKGTAATITEMAALANGKIWFGAGNRPTEVDPPIKITSGTYAGNAANDRAIPHGLGVTPKMVLILEVDSTDVGFVTGIRNVNTLLDATRTVTTWDATDFYVSETTAKFNTAATNYNWVAFE